MTTVDVAQQLLPLPELGEPHAFDDWWFRAVSSGATPHQLVAALETHDDAFLAAVRCGQVVGLTDPGASKRFAGQALLAPDPVIRAFGLARLAWLEMVPALHSAHGEVNAGQSMVGVLKSILNELASIEPRTPLLLEVIARVRRNLSEALYLSGHYDAAEVEIAQAMLIASGLGMKNALDQFRLHQAHVTYHLGRLHEALRASQKLLADSQVDLAWRDRATTLQGMLLLELGDDDAAIAWAEHAWTSDPTDDRWVSLNFALARAGRGGTDLTETEFRPYLSNESACFFRCEQLLLGGQGRPGRAELRELRRVIGEARPESPWIRAQIQYYKSLAALRLGELERAARQLPQIDDFSDEFYALKTTILALGLEIALRNDRDQRSADLLRAITRFERYFGALPLRPRRGLARRLKLGFPYAAAFAAFSPDATDEIREACADMVIEIGQRCTVFGQAIQPKLAGIITLQDFGCRFQRKLNEVQMRQEREVMLRPSGAGGGLRWFQAVSPGFVVYQFLRVHEQAVRGGSQFGTSPWRRVAEDVRSSHGLMAHPRGFETEQRRRIEGLLERVLEGSLGASQLPELLVASRGRINSRRASPFGTDSADTD